MSNLQTNFDEHHTDFTPYGEDGDYYAISDKTANFDNVLDKFQEYWANTAGEDESMPDCNVTWGIFVHQDDDTWMLTFDENQEGDAKGIVVAIS